MDELGPTPSILPPRYIQPAAGRQASLVLRRSFLSSMTLDAAETRPDTHTHTQARQHSFLFSESINSGFGSRVLEDVKHAAMEPTSRDTEAREEGCPSDYLEVASCRDTAGPRVAI